MKYITYLLLALTGFTFSNHAVAQDDTSSKPNPYSVESAVRVLRGGSANVEIPGKVFLRNKISFKNGRKAEGASSSLVLKNGKVYVLTAKHLLGDSMGISPEVLPTQFDANLKKWKVVHNDSKGTIAKVTGIYKPNDDWDEDVILLKTNANADKMYGYSIDIATIKPKIGDKLYVIGCPSALETCAQRAYAGNVADFTNFEQDPDKPKNLLLLDMIHAPKQITGFSGAAVVNEDMEVVAVMVGGHRVMMAAALLPDWVQE